MSNFCPVNECNLLKYRISLLQPLPNEAFTTAKLSQIKSVLPRTGFYRDYFLLQAIKSETKAFKFELLAKAHS